MMLSWRFLLGLPEDFRDFAGDVYTGMKRLLVTLRLY